LDGFSDLFNQGSSNDEDEDEYSTSSRLHLAGGVSSKNGKIAVDS